MSYEGDMARLVEAQNESVLIGSTKLRLATVMTIRYAFAAFVVACATAGWIFG